MIKASSLDDDREIEIETRERSDTLATLYRCFMLRAPDFPTVSRIGGGRGGRATIVSIDSNCEDMAKKHAAEACEKPRIIRVIKILPPSQPRRRSSVFLLLPLLLRFRFAIFVSALFIRSFAADTHEMCVCVSLWYATESSSDRQQFSSNRDYVT